jgi:type III secretion system FlhB-like substrate exporter
MSVDNLSIIDIGTLIVTAFVGAVAAVIAFLTYLQGKYRREKNDF